METLRSEVNWNLRQESVATLSGNSRLYHASVLISNTARLKTTAEVKALVQYGAIYYVPVYTQGRRVSFYAFPAKTVARSMSYRYALPESLITCANLARRKKTTTPTVLRAVARGELPCWRVAHMAGPEHATFDLQDLDVRDWKPTKRPGRKPAGG